MYATLEAIFVNGQCYPADGEDLPEAASNIAGFCPVTGEIWWREFYSQDHSWIIFYSPSRAGPLLRPHEVPGSIIWPYDNAPPKYFPLALLEREFFIHIAYAKEYLWQSQPQQS